MESKKSRGIVDKRKKGWFWAYNEIFEMELTPNAIAVYCFLCRMSGDSRKDVFPTMAMIGKHCSIKSPTTIRNALRELESRDLVVVDTRLNKYGGQTSNVYMILDKDVFLKDSSSEHKTNPLKKWV